MVHPCVVACSRFQLIHRNSVGATTLIYRKVATDQVQLRDGGGGHESSTSVPGDGLSRQLNIAPLARFGGRPIARLNCHASWLRRFSRRQTQMEKMTIKYRLSGKALPPRPITMKLPGWAGSANLRMENGSQPQPWHCKPFTDASTYGLELIYQYETECHIINDSGTSRIQWDFMKEPGGIVAPTEFSFTVPRPPRFFSFATSIDIQAPPGYVTRVEPHPRFYTDDTDTVPCAIGGHLPGWWPKNAFVVFKVPPRGHRAIFRKG